MERIQVSTHLVVYPNVGIPNVGLGRAANLGAFGVTLLGAAVTPELPDAVYDTRSLGAHDLGGRVSGRQGSLDAVYVAGYASPGVAAAGSVTVVDGASLVDGETVTISDGTNPPTIFEFDSGGGVLPGNVAVVFNALDTVDVVRDSLINAINITSGPGFTIIAVVSSLTTLTVDNTSLGIAGNVPILHTVADLGFAVTGMDGGVDTTPERVLLGLGNDLVSPNHGVSLTTDSNNRPILYIFNSLGVQVAGTTPSTAPIAEGSVVHLRVTWDTLNEVANGRHATMSINGQAIPEVDWTLDPVASWSMDQLAGLGVGNPWGFGGLATFNGSMQAAQVSNSVLP